MTNTNLPIAVIGGGPVGLAAVAHLIEQGETPLLFEANDRIGANILTWGHVRMFSPWEYTVDSAMVRLLETTNWQMPALTELPTGQDLVEQYLSPFAELPQVQPHLHIGARVLAVSRQAIDKMKDSGREDAAFSLHVRHADGTKQVHLAKAVLDASGTWHNPNPLGANGLTAVGELSNAARITYGIPDVQANLERYANQRVMVVGGGHSAINALLDLARLKEHYPATKILWILRNTNLARVYGGGEDDDLPARGQLGIRIQNLVQQGKVQIEAPFLIQSLQAGEDGVKVTGAIPEGVAIVTVDEIISATGTRPDLNMLRELRLDLDSAVEAPTELAPLIDPNIHSCGTVRPHGEAVLRQPEPNFYIVGSKSYGRAPTFLLATGYEQVRSIVAALVGDWTAAQRVELNLPETGVCSTDVECCTIEERAVTLPINAVQLPNLIMVANTAPVAVASPNGCCG